MSNELEDLLRLGRTLDFTNRDGTTVAATIAENLLHIRGRDGRLVPLRANAAQRAFEATRAQHNIVLKARQMGMTTWLAGRFFLRTVTQAGTMTALVAQSRDAAEGIFRTVQRMWENLPANLREGPLRRSRANVGQMVFEALDSEFRVLSAADENAGRGLTIQNLHCSEVSRWPGDAAATLAGLRAALAPGGEMVMESTPNGAYGAFYDEWQKAASSSTVQHFLPWWMEPAYVGAAVALDSQSAEEAALVARYGLTAAQIGFRRELAQSYGALRSQEFAEDAETCFRATGSCCFDVAAIEQRLSEVPDALETRRGGALQVWLRPAIGKQYVVAVDSAGGGDDGDFAAVQVVECSTGLQCAELQERLTPLQLAQAAAALAREYGHATIAVERNNHGAAVLAYLDAVERYARVWRGRDGQPGWLTTASSKAEMISNFGALLLQQPQIFAGRRLLSECRTYVAGEGGRTNAASGAHDDLLMAMAVAHMARSV